MNDDEPLEEPPSEALAEIPAAARRLAEHLRIIGAQTATFNVLLGEEQYVVTVEQVTERYPKE